MKFKWERVVGCYSFMLGTCELGWAQRDGSEWYGRSKVSGNVHRAKTFREIKGAIAADVVSALKDALSGETDGAA